MTTETTTAIRVLTLETPASKVSASLKLFEIKEHHFKVLEACQKYNHAFFAKTGNKELAQTLRGLGYLLRAGSTMFKLTAKGEQAFKAYKPEGKANGSTNNNAS